MNDLTWVNRMDLPDGRHDFGDTIFYVKDGLLHRDDGGPAYSRHTDDGWMDEWYDHGHGLYRDPGPAVVTWSKDQLQELRDLLKARDAYYKYLDPMREKFGSPSINVVTPMDMGRLMYYTRFDDLIKYIGSDDEALQAVLTIRYKYGMDFDKKVMAWYEKEERHGYLFQP